MYNLEEVDNDGENDYKMVVGDVSFARLLIWINITGTTLIINNCEIIDKSNAQTTL